MYPITKPYEGQRVTLFSKGIGTIYALRSRNTVTVDWDDGTRGVVYITDIRALLPGNDDGYFDGPPGYFAAT